MRSVNVGSFYYERYPFVFHVPIEKLYDAGRTGHVDWSDVASTEVARLVRHEKCDRVVRSELVDRMYQRFICAHECLCVLRLTPVVSAICVLRAIYHIFALRHSGDARHTLSKASKIANAHFVDFSFHRLFHVEVRVAKFFSRIY